MADNITIDTITGSPVAATDDVAGVHFQRIKLDIGGDGASSPVVTGNPLPVDASGATVPVSNAGLTELAGAINASSQVDVNVAASVAIAVTNAGITTIAGAVSGTEMQVDVLTMPTVTVNSHAVTNAGTFATQVDGAALTALQLIDDPVATLGTTTYTEATTKGMIVGAVRRDADTTLVDTTNEVGPLQMDANGRLKVEAFSGETLPVSLASVPSHAVTNAGTFATQVDGAALTALQLIDNLVLAEDAAHSTGDPGLMAFAVRRDADTALVGTDGDYAPLQVNAAGSLKVAITAGAGSGGTSIADGATFTRDSTSVTLAAAAVESSAPTLTTGDAAALSMTTAGALRVAVASGGVAGIAEDSASAGGEEGVMILAVRRDAAAVGSGTDGDFSTINVNASGRVYTTATVDAALPAGTNNIGDVDVLSLPAIPAGTNNIGDVDVLTIAAGDNNIGNVDIVTMPNVTLAAGTNTNEVVGDVAHDAAASGNPVQTGGYATNSIEGVTQVAAGDLTRTVHDLNGVQVVRPHTTLEELISERVADTAGTSAAFTNFAAGGAGVHNYISTVTIWNSSATDGYVDFRDGTAGAIKWTFPAPQTGGCTVSFDPPLKFADNTAVAYDVSAAISTVYISVNGFQAQG